MLEAEINVHTINMVGDNWVVDVKKDIKIVENILKNERKARKLLGSKKNI